MPRERVRRDLLPEDAASVIGGPLGRYAAPRARSLRHLLPLVVALVVLPMSAAVLRQGHCIANGWNGDDQFWRGCFSDLPAQYQLAGLDRGVAGWLTGTATPEPMPLLAGVMSAVGDLTPAGGWLDETRWYMAIWVALTTLLVALMVWCLGRMRPHRLDLATQLALSPVYVVAALLTADVVVVALVVAAMLAFTARRLVLAGVLLGLALLGHAWVVVVAGALLVAARRRGEVDEAVRTVATALAVAAAAALVLLVVRADIVLGPLRGWWAEGAGYGAVTKIPELLEHPLPTWSVTVVALVGWGLALVATVAMARGAWRPASWAQVAAFALPVLLLLGKSLPVQAALWVLPLAVVAGVSWRTHLGFVAVETVHAYALWFHIGFGSDPDKGLPPAWYAVVVLGRALAWCFLLWSVWYTPVDNPAPVDERRPSTPLGATPAPSTAVSPGS